MLKKEDGRIDWGMGPQEIINLVRGLNPWPGAYTRWQGMQLKIFKAEVISSEFGVWSSEVKTIEPGTIINISADGICVAAGRDALLITELQPENRSRMSASEFIRGYKIGKGQIFD